LGLQAEEELELTPPTPTREGEITEEHQQLLDEIRDAEEELNFLTEYEELLQCDLEEAQNGGVYGTILERIQK
jgi:hypothetical protein